MNRSQRRKLLSHARSIYNARLDKDILGMSEKQRDIYNGVEKAAQKLIHNSEEIGNYESFRDAVLAYSKYLHE